MQKNKEILEETLLESSKDLSLRLVYVTTTVEEDNKTIIWRTPVLIVLQMEFISSEHKQTIYKTLKGVQFDFYQIMIERILKCEG